MSMSIGSLPKSTSGRIRALLATIAPLELNQICRGLEMDSFHVRPLLYQQCARGFIERTTPTNRIRRTAHYAYILKGKRLGN